MVQQPKTQNTFAALDKKVADSIAADKAAAQSPTTIQGLAPIAGQTPILTLVRTPQPGDAPATKS